MALSAAQIAGYVHKMFPSLSAGSQKALKDLIRDNGGGHAVAVEVNFGHDPSDKASAVVTGLTWVSADSAIAVTPLTPSGVDPDEIRLLDFKPVISDIVSGVGFTLTVYSEPEASGRYTFSCVGV